LIHLAELLAATLSADEHWRANRFHFESDRRNFIIGRGLLRLILGHYLQIEPGVVSFKYGFFGKPYLPEKLNPDQLYFNLAHSHHLVLYAFSHRHIGVDIEYIRPMADMDTVAWHIFSTSEYADWLALPPTEQLEAFYNSWTCKEAYLKAAGAGLTQSPTKIEITSVPGQPTQWLGQTDESTDWVLQTINLAPGYAAALVVAGAYRQLKCWQMV
jgi:4'-phosphopantetheinyl transferase